jgi:hypothetical protein
MAEKTNQDLFVKSFEKFGSGRFFANVTLSDGTKYVYVPQEFVQKGARIGDIQYFDQAFLNQDYLKTLKPITLSEELIYDPFKQAGYKNPGSGFLISDADFKKYDKKPNEITTYNAVGKFAGEIQGIGEKDGKLVYSFAGSGGSNYGYIDTGGTPTEVTITPGKSKFGKLGEIASGIAGVFAGVPFLPEIAAAVIPGAGPVLYGSLKSLQAAGKGGDLGDVVKSGVTGAATLAAGQAILGGAQGATPPATPSTDYSLLGGGANVGGLGFKAAPEMLAPELGASIGAGGAAALAPGLVINPGALAPSLGTNLGVSPLTPDYSLLGGADTSLIGQTGITPGTPGIGLQAPTLPSLGSMGGGQGLSVPVEGGTVTQGGFTPTGAVPVLGDPGSFINDPNVLGQDVINVEPSSISLRDAFDALRNVNRVSGLLGGGGGSQPVGGGSDPGQMPAGSVDVSNLLALLSGAGARTPNIYSLLG